MNRHPPEVIARMATLRADASSAPTASVEAWRERLEQTRTRCRQGDAHAAIAATDDLLAEPLPTELRRMVLPLPAEA